MNVFSRRMQKDSQIIQKILETKGIYLKTSTIKDLWMEYSNTAWESWMDIHKDNALSIFIEKIVELKQGYING